MLDFFVKLDVTEMIAEYEESDEKRKEEILVESVTCLVSLYLFMKYVADKSGKERESINNNELTESVE